MFQELKNTISDSWSLIFDDTVEKFIDIEAQVNKVTLGTKRGDLMSMLRINGSRKLAGEKELEDIHHNLTIRLSGPMSEAGHSLQIVFIRDPKISENELEILMESAKAGAQITDLDLEDVFGDREAKLSDVLSQEDLLICCWSHVSALNSEEIKRNKQEDLEASKEWPWRHSETLMDPFAGSRVLLPQHEGFVQTVLDAFAHDGKGLDAELLTARDAIREVRKAIRPEFTWPEWQPFLDDDPITLKQPHISTPDDFSNSLWPKLAHQICDTDFTVDGHTLKSDGRLWAPIDLTRMPLERRSFNDLIRRLHKMDVPFRMSFLIEGGQNMDMRRTFASFLRFTNSSNTLLRDAIDERRDAALHGQAVVRVRCSLATLTDARSTETEQVAILRRNLAHLERAVQGWGRAEVTNKTGDPLEALFSTVPGAACRGTGNPALGTLGEALHLLPLQRPANPSEEGTHIFRSQDGKPWPYKPDSGQTPFVCDLIQGIPGMVKSVLQNSMALSSLLGAKTAKLPYMAILDIGRSSSGLISLLKEALPKDRRHEAEHIRLVNSKEMAVNPHDLQLGFRSPLKTEKEFLEILYGLLVTGPNEDLSADMSDLITNVVTEIYRMFSDQGENVDPKKYTKNTDPIVTQALDHLDFSEDIETTWWEVVDFLFERGDTIMASRAQRFAVPILADAQRAANNDRVKNLFANTLQNGENIVDVFNRRINTAAGKFPILSRETFFDIGSTRVCALDLSEVTGGESKEDKHQSSIFYMFTRHALAHHWWFERDMATKAPKLYQAFHDDRIKSLLDMPKRLMYDEFHRTGNIPQVSNQLLRDVRETRKMNVQISVATQLLNDFSQEIVDMASAVWVLGMGLDETQIDALLHKFALSETAGTIVRHYLGPPDREGAMVLNITKAKGGRYEQLLYNSLGSRELWALTTTPEDVALREELTRRAGAPKARAILAKRFPDASAKSEIKRIIDERTRSGDIKRATKEAVSADLVTQYLGYK